MSQYNYVVKPRAQQRIFSFYHNVAKKYKHTYDFEDFMRNVRAAIDAMYQIEHTLMRRVPTIPRWIGYHMANTDKWYFAYTIDDDTITIVDACHAQNMHE